MADPEEKREPAPSTAAPTPKKSTRRAKPAEAEAAPPAAPPAKAPKKAEGPKAPRRPTLDPEAVRLLTIRAALGDARPHFGRQAANRYFRIGRWQNWRTPRGLQSKQRRHYGYRPRVVRIGFGSPALTRGLTPTGFRPIVVRTVEQIDGIDPAREAAVIARTVGTRRRLVLEETARKRGVKVLNPIVKEEAPT
ncbi:MAG TPA: 50S ribosomal protein L32e [Thermoplasmata archaeon]|nr:50S ribosomal protein L32e [Thermoplasmata archaeon]